MFQFRRAWGVPLVLAAGCWFAPRPTVPTRHAVRRRESVSLVNASAIPICFVYLWRPREQHGGDWLGQNETVASGTRREFRVAPAPMASARRLRRQHRTVAERRRPLAAGGGFSRRRSCRLCAAPGYQRSSTASCGCRHLRAAMPGRAEGATARRRPGKLRLDVDRGELRLDVGGGATAQRRADRRCTR